MQHAAHGAQLMADGQYTEAARAWHMATKAEPSVAPHFSGLYKCCCVFGIQL